MTKLHDRTFGQSQEDAERDQILATRTAALQFVRPEHLEISPHMMDEANLAMAIKELNKINMYKVRQSAYMCLVCHASADRVGGMLLTCVMSKLIAMSAHAVLVQACT